MAMQNSQALTTGAHQAQRIAARIVEVLGNLGFRHENQDGTVFQPTFCDIVLYGGSWLVCEVDVERLWHTPIARFNKGVEEHVGSALRKPVRIIRRNGLYIVVDIRPPELRVNPRLPNKCDLDLDKLQSGALQVPVGELADEPLTRTLASLGHCLIVGATGAGKSTWLHCALAALLTANSPDKLQVVLIDPKQLELSTWSNAPHLRGSVACDVETATAALASLVQEMDNRGQLFAAIGARDLEGYNRRAADPLPAILCVIDECLDLMLQAGDRSELVNLLKRLSSKARATGIYLWLSATHGTADILPRVVSVNLASRIVFRVADGSAARVAGCPGAQSIPRTLPGRLYARLADGTFEAQGYWLDDARLHALASGFSRATTGPALTDVEQALFAWAISENGGYLSLAEIERVGGLGQKEARRLADQLERRGLLAKDAGRDNKRRLTQAALDLAK